MRPSLPPTLRNAWRTAKARPPKSAGSTLTRSPSTSGTGYARAQQGEYREMREVIFSPTGDRTERFAGKPVSRLKNLEMTPEDFADIRNIQPFVMTEDKLRIYEVQYKGEELVDEHDCWVLSIRPRQILSEQRLFDGLLWIRKDDFSVIRSEGKAVPEIVGLKQENLFPRFTTVRRLVNGFWFPSITSADDTLYFRSGPSAKNLSIRYNDYKKFGSDTTITFDKCISSVSRPEKVRWSASVRTGSDSGGSQTVSLHC